MLSKMHHPNIVQFLGVYYSMADMPVARAGRRRDAALEEEEDDPRIPILVMEHLPMTVCCYAEESEPLPPSQLPHDTCYSILRDVALGLRYLHEQKSPIVHRDLTAKNVLLSEQMTAKIADLGVARILDIDRNERKKLTECPGNFAYMPPEAMCAKPTYHTPVDIFSFGVLILHIFAREWPFPDDIIPDPTNPDRLVGRNEVQRRELYIKKLGQDHPLKELITSCLSNAPDRRPSACVVLQTIESVQASFPRKFLSKFEADQLLAVAQEEAKQLRAELEKKALDALSVTEHMKRVDADKQSIKEESVRLTSCLEQSKAEAEELFKSLQVQEAQLKHKDQELVKKESIIEDIKHQVSSLISTVVVRK